MHLAGQVAIVTGGSRGIGHAIAESLAASGAHVALWARNEEQVQEAGNSIECPAGCRVLAQAVDVRQQSVVVEALAHAEAELGPVTLLVNNAGTGGPAGNEWEVDADQWWECVESAVRGAFVCAKAVLPGMLRRGAGRIVEMVSATGTNAFPMLSATSVAKAALIRHAENLGAATAGTGVTAFALHPGMVETQLLNSYRSNADVAAFLDSIPPDFYSSPHVAGTAVSRIANGDFDALTGCYIDATGDLDLIAYRAASSLDLHKMRLVTN